VQKNKPLIAIIIIISIFTLVINSQNKTYEEKQDNPDEYFKNEFLEETYKFSADVFNICNPILEENFIGEKYSKLLRYENYFIEVDKYCFSNLDIQESIIEHSKGVDGDFSYFYTRTQPNELVINYLIKNTQNESLKINLIDLQKEKNKLDEAQIKKQNECQTLISENRFKISAPLSIIDKAAEIVVFPDNYSREEGDIFFTESIDQLNNLNYFGIENEKIKTLFQLAKPAKTILLRGLKNWHTGFKDYKSGFSSYERKLKAGDIDIDNAFKTYSEILRKFDAYSCDFLLDNN